MMVVSKNKRWENNNLAPKTSGEVTLGTSINSKFDIETKSSSKQSRNIEKKVI